MSVESGAQERPSNDNHGTSGFSGHDGASRSAAPEVGELYHSTPSGTGFRINKTTNGIEVNHRRVALKIRWDNLSPFIETLIRPIVEEYLWIIPPWLQSLRIHISDPAEDRQIARIFIDAPYRLATIAICPQVWEDRSLDIEDLHYYIVHELCHIVTSPAFEGINKCIDTAFGSDEPGPWVALSKQHARDLAEQVTCDLAQSIVRERFRRLSV